MSNMRNSHLGITLTLPLFVILPRKRTVDKKFYLNLNVYRNAHYQILNDAKHAFKEQVLGAMADINFRIGDRLATPVKMTYTYYQRTNIKSDISNVLSIVQKFADDALVELGVLPNDDYTSIPHVEYRFGGVDKLNPRAELTIQTQNAG